MAATLFLSGLAAWHRSVAPVPARVFPLIFKGARDVCLLSDRPMTSSFGAIPSYSFAGTSSMFIHLRSCPIFVCTYFLTPFHLSNFPFCFANLSQNQSLQGSPSISVSFGAFRSGVVSLVGGWSPRDRACPSVIVGRVWYVLPSSSKFFFHFRFCYTVIFIQFSFLLLVLTSFPRFLPRSQIYLCEGLLPLCCSPLRDFVSPLPTLPDLQHPGEELRVVG